jgi:DNA-binding response OmpR family regulator
LWYNLNQEGYQIFTAANGKERAKAKRRLPDLIIMDVMMPDGRYGSVKTSEKIQIKKCDHCFLSYKRRLSASGRV